MISRGNIVLNKSLSILMLLLAVMTLNCASAQKFTATVSPATVAAGQPFKLTYSIAGNGHDFRMPKLSGVDVLSGPSYEQNFNIINGDVSMANSYSLVLRARAKGTLLISPASITVNGRTIYSNSVKVNVQGSMQQPFAGNSGNDNTAGNSDIFIRAGINKKEAVQGEALAVTYKLYVHNMEVSQMIQTRMPNFSGFWVENVTMPKQLPFSIENYKGKDYRVYVVKKMILFSQKTGTLTIDPLEIECTGRQEVERRPDPNSMFPDFPFDDDFFHATRPFHLTLKSDGVSVKVDPLPDKDKPTSFAGFVGQGAVSAAIDSKEAKQNEPLTYKVTVGGEGPLSLVQPFKLKLPDGVDAYDPKTVDKIDREGNNLSGTRTFEYTLLPRNEGSFTIPPVAFSYYDPAKRKYIESKTSTFTIKVEKGEPQSSSHPGNGSDFKSIHVLNAIRKWSWIAMAPIALALLVLLVVRSRKPSPVPVEQEDEVLEANPARKDWRDHLAAAEEMTGQPEFYGQVLMAMYSFLNEKFGMSLANATHQHIKETLVSNNVSEANRSAFTGLIERCEFANYAPGASSGLSQENLLQEVKRLLEEMDRG